MSYMIGRDSVPLDGTDRKESTGWKIMKVTNADQVRTPLPFGTAVTE